MKILARSIVSIIVVCTLILFQNCKKDKGESDKDVTTNMLTSKGWVVSSVNVPSGTATLSEDWANFSLSFTATNITTSGHPVGSGAVWPSGTFTVSEDGKTITRQDGVVMQCSITETSIRATFSVPPGTETGGRIAALEGEYTFNMQ